MNCMGSMEDWKLAVCRQKYMRVMEKQTHFYPRNMLHSQFVKQAFQKITPSRFQHNSSPQKGKAPSKIKRLTYSTFPKNTVTETGGKGRAEEKH